MDLKTLRETLSEMKSTHDRIAAELRSVKERLEAVAASAAEKKAFAKETAVDAVIKGTKDARAEADAAKAALTAAFEEETALRDTIPALENALARVDLEIRKVQDAIGVEENTRVMAAIRERAPKVNDALREAAVEMLLQASQGGTSGFIDLEFLVGERIEKMRSTIEDRYREVLASIRREVAP